ncbi:MAG: zinc ABC transporter substrate-binding protein [Phycisphaerales bacterium]|nr:zinc ABC transporter substrate-binding protein [Phycisphaerales bacterium]
MTLRMVLTIAAMLACAVGCRKEAPVTSAPSPRGGVLTTFYPTTYFASRIAGGLVPVECPLPAGEDPATWEPGSAAMRQYQSASLVVINGASFEEWVPRAPLPRSRVVDTTAAVQGQLLRYEHAVTHSHGMAGKHSHEGIDGHTWLDPIMAIAQAEAIRDAMIAEFPGHADAFRSNAQALIADLRSLDIELRAMSEAMQDVTVICSHPAYNYLGKRYGWNLVIAVLDPESDLTPDDVHELEHAAEGANLCVVLWESPTSQANERLIRESIGAVSVLYSPCEQTPESGDFLTVMQTNIERLRGAIQP